MALLKPVYSMEEVLSLYQIQQSSYDLITAYNFVCTEFENALHEAFAFTGEPLPVVETVRTKQTVLVRAMALSCANHVFVTYYLGHNY